MKTLALPKHVFLRLRLARLAACLVLLALVFACARLPESTENQPPEILSIVLSPSPATAGSQVLFTAQVEDPEGDSLSGHWQLNRGSILAQYGDSVRWQSPDSTTYTTLIYTVEDSHGNLAADTLYFWVENRTPTFTELGQESPIALNGNTLTLWAHAIDPDSQAVALSWSSPWGALSSTVGDTVRWTAPDTTLSAWIRVTATDPWGVSLSDTLRVRVYSEIGCVWVLDSGNSRVVKLSADGDLLLEIPGLSQPSDLDLDPESRRLWVSELEPPALKAFDLQGNLLLDIAEGFTRPTRIKARYRTGSVLVLDRDSSRVVEVEGDGQLGQRVIAGLDRPLALGLHQRSGMLWVADEGDNRVWQIPDSYSGTLTPEDSLSGVRVHNGFQFPYDLSVEDSTGACWVVDKDAARLIRYGAEGLDSLVVGGFDNPVAVAAGRSEGLAWVLDRNASGQALRMFFDLEQVQFTGVRFPKALAFNPLDANCWVLDGERNQVLRINAQGQLVGSWSSFNFPSRVVVNGGY
jgi:DNA-binding beta-propeller fold protein YncE